MLYEQKWSVQYELQDDVYKASSIIHICSEVLLKVGSFLPFRFIITLVFLLGADGGLASAPFLGNR